MKRVLVPLLRLSVEERLYFTILVVMSSIMGVFCFNHIRTVRFVGYADPAAYAHVANNILDGEGAVQNFVDFFFTSYPTVLHYSEHWFSFYTVLLLPFLAMLGVSAWVVKLPTFLCYLLLPWVTYLIFRKWYDPQSAFFAALTLQLDPYILEYGINGWPDIPFTVLALLILWMVRGMADRRRIKGAILTGVSLGCLCWMRASGYLIVLGLAYHFLREGMWKTKVRLRNGSICILSMMLIVLISQLLSLSADKDALFSSHFALAATMGYGSNPQEEHWQLFWNDPPDLRKKIVREGFSVVWQKVGRELSALVIRRDYFEENPTLLVMVGPLLLIFGLWRAFVSPSDVPDKLLRRISVIYLLLLAIFFKMNSRYLFLIQTLLCVMGWRQFRETMSNIIEASKKQLPHLGNSMKEGWVVFAVMLVFALGSQWGAFSESLHRFSKSDTRYPFNDDYYTLQVFQFIRNQTAPKDTVMCTLPWSLTFHTGRPSVMVPYGSIKDLIAVARRYRCTYLLDINGHARRLLFKFPEFQPVARWDRAWLYAIKYNAVRRRNNLYHSLTVPLYVW